MDSDDVFHDATPSNSSTYKVKTLKMIAAASLKTRFYETYCRRQPFAFPDSVMHYIAKNPSTLKCYQKMVKSCKYFFVKNPALVIYTFIDNFKGKRTTYVDKEHCDLDNIGCKLWITERLTIYDNFSETNLKNRVSSIVPKIYRCDAETLDIANQAISYQDYCFLSTCAEEIEFHNVTVKNADGSITPLEKLIEAAPKLKDAFFRSDDEVLSNITSNTVQELVKLPNFSKLKYLRLNPIPETFNFDAFYVYMKTNKFTKFYLIFADSLSEAYKKHLEKIIDEILDEDGIDFMPPFINFDGIDPEKERKFLSN